LDDFRNESKAIDFAKGSNKIPKTIREAIKQEIRKHGGKKNN
jgi:hypothetical protein